MSLQESVIRSPRTGLPCKESKAELKARVVRYKSSDEQLRAEMDVLEIEAIVTATTEWLGPDWLPAWPRWAV